MKADRGGTFRAYRREYSVDRPPHDPYKPAEKLSEPTRCPGCKATWLNGRWTWEGAPSDANEEMCPACQRIEDRFLAGYVKVQGSFQAEHRDEIIKLIQGKEAREKAEHPLQRIMTMEDVAAGLSGHHDRFAPHARDRRGAGGCVRRGAEDQVQQGRESGPCDLETLTLTPALPQGGG